MGRSFLGKLKNLFLFNSFLSITCKYIFITLIYDYSATHTDRNLCVNLNHGYSCRSTHFRMLRQTKWFNPSFKPNMQFNTLGYFYVVCALYSEGSTLQEACNPCWWTRFHTKSVGEAQTLSFSHPLSFLSIVWSPCYPQNPKPSLLYCFCRLQEQWWS